MTCCPGIGPGQAPQPDPRVRNGRLPKSEHFPQFQRFFVFWPVRNLGRGPTRPRRARPAAFLVPQKVVCDRSSAPTVGRDMAALKIVYKDPGQLKPRAKKPRTHTRRQIRQIAASITEFGFINPILIDAANGIIAGHGRVEAAKLLGMSDVPTVQVDHLTPAQIRAYVIADNRLAENAGWDRALLALELQELSVHHNFDVTVTGFETAEIDLLIRDLNGDSPEGGCAPAPLPARCLSPQTRFPKPQTCRP